MAFAGISRDGSSSSGSSGTGVAGAGGVGATAGATAGRDDSAVTGLGAWISVAALSAGFFGGSAGVSSTVECLPVVQGGIVRNSSKVRTRGLQHFQPVWSVQSH